MQTLARRQRVFAPDLAPIVVMTQIRMSVAVGIRHLRNDRAQGIRIIINKPKTHRVEHMPQNTRLRQNLDPTDRKGNIRRAQNLPHPNSTPPSLGRTTMIDVVQRHQTTAVARKQKRRAWPSLSVQQNVIHRIAERIVHFAFATMKGLPIDMIDATCHSAATAIKLRVAIVSTTSIALANPSS